MLLAQPVEVKKNVSLNEAFTIISYTSARQTLASGLELICNIWAVSNISHQPKGRISLPSTRPSARFRLDEDPKLHTAWRMTISHRLAVSHPQCMTTVCECLSELCDNVLDFNYTVSRILTLNLVKRLLKIYTVVIMMMLWCTVCEIKRSEPLNWPSKICVTPANW